MEDPVNEKINGKPVTEEMIRSWADEAEGGYIVTPPKEDWICRLIWTIGDMAGLPVGTRVATNDGKLLVLAEMFGGHQWVDRTGQLYSPLVSWLPVIVLPPAVRGL